MPTRYVKMMLFLYCLPPTLVAKEVFYERPKNDETFRRRKSRKKRARHL